MPRNAVDGAMLSGYTGIVRSHRLFRLLRQHGVANASADAIAHHRPNAATFFLAHKEPFQMAHGNGNPNGGAIQCSDDGRRLPSARTVSGYAVDGAVLPWNCWPGGRNRQLRLL